MEVREKEGFLVRKWVQHSHLQKKKGLLQKTPGSYKTPAPQRRGKRVVKEGGGDPRKGGETVIQEGPLHRLEKRK